MTDPITPATIARLRELLDAANKFLDNHLIKTKTQRREYV